MAMLYSAFEGKKTTLNQCFMGIINLKCADSRPPPISS